MDISSMNIETLIPYWPYLAMILLFLLGAVVAAFMFGRSLGLAAGETLAKESAFEEAQQLLIDNALLKQQLNSQQQHYQDLRQQEQQHFSEQQRQQQSQLQQAFENLQAGL